MADSLSNSNIADDSSKVNKRKRLTLILFGYFGVIRLIANPAYITKQISVPFEIEISNQLHPII